jgi:hypothetical protein
MFSKFVKFEMGVLIGTIIGAVVATIVCSAAFNAFGFDSSDIFMIQECLIEELNDKTH